MNSKIIDAGVNTNGNIEAALIISEICMGGLGSIKIVPSNEFNTSLENISVYSSNPVLSCLGSQYAGWSLNHESFFHRFGPARSLAQKEEIFSKINYSDKNTKTCLVLEVDKAPPIELLRRFHQIAMYWQKYYFHINSHFVNFWYYSLYQEFLKLQFIRYTS